MKKYRVIKSVLVLAGVGLALSACQEVVTPGGSAEYSANYSAGTLTVSNANDSGVNEREAFINSKTPVEAASSECETWDTGTSPTQDGLFFRATSATGGWNGVELERSFYEAETASGYFQVIYFHDGTFDTGPQVVLTSYLAKDPVWPINVCASITAAGVLSFAVSSGSAPVPALGTAGEGDTWALNTADMPAAGQTGSYVAHLPTGASATISSITVDGVASASPLG